MANTTPRTCISHYTRQAVFHFDRSVDGTSFEANRTARALICQAMPTGNHRNLGLRCSIWISTTRWFRNLRIRDRHLLKRSEKPTEHLATSKRFAVVLRSHGRNVVNSGGHANGTGYSALFSSIGDNRFPIRRRQRRRKATGKPAVEFGVDRMTLRAALPIGMRGAQRGCSTRTVAAHAVVAHPSRVRHGRRCPHIGASALARLFFTDKLIALGKRLVASHPGTRWPGR